VCIYKYVKMHEQQQVFCIRLIFKFVCVGVVRVFAVVSADAIAVVQLFHCSTTTTAASVVVDIVVAMDKRC